MNLDKNWQILTKRTGKTQALRNFLLSFSCTTLAYTDGIQKKKKKTHKHTLD